MSKTFKGTDTLYHVVGEKDGASFGVGISLTGGKFLVRFSTLGFCKTPPVHFNFRAKGGFKDDTGASQIGLYFDKVTFPVVDSYVGSPTPAFAKLCDDLDIPEVLSEWIVRQFKLEGIEIDPALDLPGVIKALYTDVPEEKLAPVFVLPLDLVHHKTKYDKPSGGAKTQEASYKETSALPEGSSPVPEVPEDLDAVSLNDLCDLSEALDPDGYQAILDEEQDFSDEEFRAALIELLQPFVKKENGHESD